MEDRFEEISNRFDDDRIIIKLAELRVIGFIYFFFFRRNVSSIRSNFYFWLINCPNAKFVQRISPLIGSWLTIILVKSIKIFRSTHI